jgi:hypothetical protein
MNSSAQLEGVIHLDMLCFGGIGDTLEDDVKHMHQISAQIESRVSQMKNKGQQAHFHSKFEVIQNCAMVKEKIEES